MDTSAYASAKARLGKLRPTQMTLGYAEVSLKRKEWRKRSADGAGSLRRNSAGRRYGTCHGDGRCPAASRIKRVISSGCEISERWLAFTSMVSAPIRLAMKRSRSGLMVRSSVETA